MAKMHPRTQAAVNWKYSILGYISHLPRLSAKANTERHTHGEPKYWANKKHPYQANLEKVCVTGKWQCFICAIYVVPTYDNSTW